MSQFRKNLRSPKSRQLRFETMEERLYLSATPNELLYSDPTAHPTTEYLGECSEECIQKWSRPNTNNSFETPLTIEWENGQWNYDYSEWSLSLQVIVREDIDLMRKHVDEFPQDWDSEHQCYWHYLQMKDPNGEYPDITQIIFGSDYDVPLNQNPDYDATEYVLPPTYNSIAGEYENFTHLDTVREMFGLTGTNQTIVVIDTGLDMNHSAFQTDNGSKVVGWYDFSNPDATELTDKNGNGTHTAAVIGSVDPNHLGVAPGADLLMLKVGGDNVDAKYGKRLISSENVARALQWVIDHKDDPQFVENPITVVNISLAPGNMMQIVRERIEILQEAGIIVSIMERTDTSVYSFGAEGNPSNIFGLKHPGQLLAPGERIVSAIPGDAYGEKTGAGVATAYMSGAYALVYEALVSMKGEHLHEFIEYNTDLTFHEYVHNLLKINSDSAWSSEDYRNYDRLNLLHTVQNILGKDSAGDTASEAHNLYDVYYGTSYSDGVFNHVGDTDYYQFTAWRSGTVTISRSFVHNDTLDRAVWLDAAGNAIPANKDGSVTLTVEAGQTYFFGIQSEEVGKYSLHLNLETEKTPTVGVRKVQDGLFNSEGEILQKLIFEFERTVDPDDPTALDQPLTIPCFYSVSHPRAETRFNRDNYTYDTYLSTDISVAVLREQMITFQPGETKAYWEIESNASHKIWTVYLLSNGSAENSGDYLVDSQNSNSSGRIQLHRDNLDQAAPTIKISRVQDGILDTEGNWIQQPVFEIERVIDRNAPESLQQPLTVDYVFFTKDAATLVPQYPGREMSVTFQSGETKIQVSYDFAIDMLGDQLMYVDCVLAKSLPELNGGAPQYHVEMNNSRRADVTVEDASRPTINMKTVQHGAVSPNGQIQQSIIFEFERAHNPNDPDALNQALTIEYELYLHQGVETDYRNEIAHLLNGPLSLTFQPGQTTVQLEFSGLGYKEYKSSTSLQIRLLGTYGANPKILTDTYSASSAVSLVDNPGEQSIPRVSVKVVPGAVPHGDKIYFEIERKVDPNDPHALDEPLEIRYDDKGGWYPNWGGFRGKAITLEGRSPKFLVFQPGQSKIVLEYSRPGPNSWIEFKIFGPTGASRSPWVVSDEPLEINTWTDYIVEQWMAEADYETPCTSPETAPILNVVTIQDGVIDADGNVVQNPILEFERVFDPSDSEALNKPLTMNFHFQGVYSNIIGYQVFDDYSIQFQPGETKVRFEYDTQALLDSGLDIREMTCTLGTSGSGFVFEEAEHYHVGTRFAKLRIVEGKTADANARAVGDETPITAPNFTISGPAEDELFEKSSLWWKITAETSSQRPTMNWEINWGDGSENMRILGGPRNDIQIPHHFRQGGTYTITVKTTDLTGLETTTTIGTYTIKPRNTVQITEEMLAESFLPIAPEPDADVIVAAPSLPEETPVVETHNAIQVLSFASQESRTTWFDPAAQNANRIAEIDLLFQTEQTPSVTNFDFEDFSAGPLFSEESASNALDAVFETDWDLFALTPLLPETLQRN